MGQQPPCASANCRRGEEFEACAGGSIRRAYRRLAEGRHRAVGQVALLPGDSELLGATGEPGQYTSHHPHHNLIPRMFLRDCLWLQLGSAKGVERDILRYEAAQRAAAATVVSDVAAVAASSGISAGGEAVEQRKRKAEQPAVVVEEQRVKQISIAEFARPNRQQREATEEEGVTRRPRRESTAVTEPDESVSDAHSEEMHQGGPSASEEAAAGATAEPERPGAAGGGEQRKKCLVLRKPKPAVAGSAGLSSPSEQTADGKAVQVAEMVAREWIFK